MESMVRNPPKTRLLNGQVMNLVLGFTSVTATPGSSRRRYLAQDAPPNPPPITTTRALPLPPSAARAVEAQPSTPAAAAAPAILRKSLRVILLMSSPYL